MHKLQLMHLSSIRDVNSFFLMFSRKLSCDCRCRSPEDSLDQRYGPRYLIECFRRTCIIHTKTFHDTRSNDSRYHSSPQTHQEHVKLPYQANGFCCSSSCQLLSGLELVSIFVQFSFNISHVRSLISI